VWPNPFVTDEAVGGTLKAAYVPTGARLLIFTVSGEKIVEIGETRPNHIEWDGRNSKGRPASNGTYYYLVMHERKPFAKGVVILINPWANPSK